MQVSKLSQLGFCQAAFRFSHELKIVTVRMTEGVGYHKTLINDVPLFKPDDLQRVRRGETFSAREVDVGDKSLMLTGRIDQIDFCGSSRQSSGLNLSVIFDDKFPRNPGSFSVSDAHKIQLASYALAFGNDERFRDAARIFFASIRVWDKTRTVKTFDVNRHELRRWENTIPDLIDSGKKILWNRLAPQPIAFCMDKREWLHVGNRCFSCKYSQNCEYRNDPKRL